MTLAVYVASVAAVANRFKVPPLMQVLISDLHVDMAMGGWFMSVFSVAALVLAIPSAFLLTRVGLKATGLVALGCSVAGSALGALAPSPAALLVARVIEGIAVGLISVMAPTAISLWFDPQERGLPLGIWVTWVPVGNVLMFNVAYPLAAAFGWRAVWWFGALLSAAAALLFALVVADPRPSRPLPRQPNARGSLASFGRTLPNLPSWLLGLAFAAFAFALFGYTAWAPAYLSETLGMAPALASSYASLLFLAGIPGNVVAGWATGRTPHRHRLLALSFLLAGILFAWGFRLITPSLVVPYMLLLGFVANLVPTVIFAIAPETMASLEFAGLGVAITIACANLGNLLGPPAVGAVIEQGGWAAGNTALVASMGAGLAVVLLTWRISFRRKLARRNRTHYSSRAT
jgi:predicted MFS family arabinose efflux permease